jgi:amino acid adenylation domain-containing protein
MKAETNIEAIYPLTPTQEGMLFHSLAAGMYLQQLICEIRSAVDAVTLKEAWSEVCARHAVLRTFFFWKDRPKPIQVVCKAVPLSWDEQDWQGGTLEEQSNRLARFLGEDRARGFDLARPPLSRCTLLRLGKEHYYFVWAFHHMLLDGWSLPLVLNEVFAFYEGRRVGRPVSLPDPRPFRDYVAWLMRRDDSGDEAAWQERLRGFSSPVSLRLGPAEPSLPGVGEHRSVLPDAMYSQLQAVAKAHRVTLNAIAQAAWAVLLAAYSGERDIVFGATHSGRPAALHGVESMVGLFINTLPVRIRIDADELFPGLAHRLLTEQFGHEAHRYASLADVQSWSEVPRGTPLFETLLVFENYPLPHGGPSAAASLNITNLHTIERTNYPITLMIVPDRRMEVRITFDESQFGTESMRRLLDHFLTVLKAVCREPGCQVGQIRLLEGVEEEKVLRTWNDTCQPWADDPCVHHWFERQAAATPDRTALVFRGEKLTYRDLNERANQLAHYLHRSGVGPESLVGVCMERSVELVVALYAVLKAGGAYVPLDPEYPEERLAFMMADAASPILITQRALVSRLSAFSGRILCWQDIREELAGHPVSNPQPDVHPNQLAYMIYTSGSTGRPKGAMNSHRGLSNRIRWMQDTYRLTGDDRVLQKTPFSFDVSVWEFFWPLTAGACLVVAEPGGHQDPACLVEAVKRWGVTTLHFVPPMLDVFLDEKAVESCTSLQRVICSGEALPWQLQDRFFRKLHAELHNLYGPTEASIDVTSWQCERETSRGLVPIGRPIANTQIYILNDFLHPVPIEATGEIYIGGVGLARGYHRRPDLTAEKFIPSPFGNETGGRLYRTGDLARFRSDGAIEYLGRRDHQVKMRGFRIELGEIEAALGGHPSVRDAVVVVRAEPLSKQLVGYLVLTPGCSERPDSFRDFLRDRLPEHMIPNRFVMLATLPLTPNGKVDRRALPAPEAVAVDASFGLPQSEAERVIAEIWREFLQVDRVGLNENFFELGGDSLRMVPIHHRLEEVFEQPLSIVELFRYPTVRALAQRLTERQESAPAAASTNGSRGERRDGMRARRELRQRHRSNYAAIASDE